MTTLATETWTGANGAAWPAQWTTGAATGGAVDIQGNAGRMRSGTAGYAYARGYLSGMAAVTDLDVVASWQFTAANVEQYLAFHVSADNTSWSSDAFFPQNGYTVQVTYAATAAAGRTNIYKTQANTQTNPAVQVTRTLVGTTSYSIRIQRSGNTIRYRLWDSAVAEPSTWDSTWTDPSSPLGAGRLLLTMSNGSPATQQTATVDNLTVATLPVPGGPPMATWQAALATAATTGAVCVSIGSSKTEGQGASTRANRWLSKVQDKYRTAFPSAAAGGLGFIPPWHAVGVPSTSWATTATAETGTVAKTGAANFGHRTATFSTGATQTYTVVGTDLDLWWVSNGAGGAFTYKIDAATAVSVTTTGANNTAGRTTVTGLSAGSHTVVITATSSFIFGGITVFNGDRSIGVKVYDAGHSGHSSTNYNDAAMLAAITLLTPDLVTIDVGGNEQSAGLTPAQMSTNLQTIITTLRGGAKQPSVALIGPWLIAPDDGTWEPYRVALANLASSQNAVFVDLSTLMPLADTTGTGYYTADGNHGNDSGQERIAQLVYGLTAATGRLLDAWNGTTPIRRKSERWNGTALVQQTATV